MIKKFRIDGAFVCFCLRKNNMNQKNMAFNLGISRPTLCQILKGRSLVDQDRLKKIKEYLKIEDVEILIDEAFFNVRKKHVSLYVSNGLGI